MMWWHQRILKHTISRGHQFLFSAWSEYSCGKRWFW